MRAFSKPFRAIAAVVLALWPATLASQGSPAATTATSWVGGIATGGLIAVRLDVRPSARGPAATVSYVNQPPERQALPVDSFSFAGGHLHAEWKDGDAKAILDGTLKNAGSRDSIVIEGSFEQGNTRGTFYLTPGATVTRESIARSFGLYQLEPGHLLWLGEMSELSRRPAFIDAKTGRFGALYAAHPDTLFSGPTALVPAPVSIRLATASRDWPSENTRVLRLITAGGSPQTATRLDAYTTEQVTFFNDTVRLSGTLVLPTAKGPHPAVVFIHGSGGGTRSYFSGLPFFLAANGIASLVYDKRGSGGSTGDRHISPFENLADDALAGVRLLARRPDVDSRRIGLYGHSQGGWVAPLAASRSNGAVAFVVSIAGPAQDFERQTNDEIRNVMREYGISDADAEKAMEHQALWWRVYRGKAPYSELEAASRIAISQPWIRFLFNSGRNVPPTLVIDPPGAYDPEPVLRRLRTPMLAVYGGRDNRVLGEKNTRLMEAHLGSAGNRDYTVKLFPTGNHDIIEVGDWPVTDALRTTRYSEGYLPFLIDWIMTRAFAKPGRPAERERVVMLPERLGRRRIVR